VDWSRTVEGPFLVAAAVKALPHFSAMILAALGKVGTRQHLRRLTFPARTPELMSVFTAVVGVFWRFIRHAQPFDVRHRAPTCTKQSYAMFFEPLTTFYKFAQERGIDVDAFG
jgi:hypothetical protein